MRLMLLLKARIHLQERPLSDDQLLFKIELAVGCRFELEKLQERGTAPWNSVLRLRFVSRNQNIAGRLLARLCWRWLVGNMERLILLEEPKHSKGYLLMDTDAAAWAPRLWQTRWSVAQDSPMWVIYPRDQVPKWLCWPRTPPQRYCSWSSYHLSR